jgi:hypothetical protein
MVPNAHEKIPKETDTLKRAEQGLHARGIVRSIKSANLLYTQYLARHLKSQQPNILSNATHTGFFETRQATEHIKEA